jgi:hypothetical protein
LQRLATGPDIENRPPPKKSTPLEEPSGHRLETLLRMKCHRMPPKKPGRRKPKHAETLISKGVG